MRSSVAATAAHFGGLIAVNDNARRDAEQSAIMRVLGQVEATVKAIQADIDEIKTVQKDDRHDSSEGRRRLHEKFESVQDNLQKTNSTVKILGLLVDKQSKDIEGVTKAVKSLEPTVEATAATVRNYTIRGGVILGGLAFVAGLLWYIVTNYGVALWRWADQFIPR